MEGLLEILAVLVLLGILVVGGAAVLGQVVGRVVIHEYERGVRMDAGRVVGLVGPGTVTYLRPTTQILVVDTRPAARTLEGQEVLTADGVAIKVSLVLRSVIGDPVARLHADQDPDQLIYLLVQLGLRDVVARQTVDEVVAGRSAIGPAILDLVATRLGAVGVEVLSIDVRDVMLPADLKRAQVAVLAARYEGAVALERARGETAALRSLGNAAKLLDEHPGLRSLRLVQELSGSGNTVVLGLGEVPVTGTGTPRPVDRA